MNGGTGHKTPADALRALLEELGGLRNANARDPVFKAWRQNTLTLVQRVWQFDTTRAERFRRVPFSPPSSKSNATVRRQYFERGCSEAIWLLRDWIEDARRNNLSFGDPGRPSAPALPGSQEDDFPVLDLPADGSTVDQVSNDAVNTTPMAPDAAPNAATPPRAPGARSDAPRPPLVSPFAEPIDLPPAAPEPARPVAHARPAAPVKPAASAKPAPAKPAAKPAPPKSAKPHEHPKPAPPRHAPAPKPVAAAPPAPPPPPPVVAQAPPAQPIAPAPPPAPAPGYEAELDAAFDAFLDGKGGQRPARDAKRSAPKRALKDMLGFSDEMLGAAPEEPIAHVPAPEPVAEAPRATEPEPVIEAPYAPVPEPAADDELPFEIVTAPEAPPEPPIAFVRPPGSGTAVPAPVTREPYFESSDLPDFEVFSEELERTPPPPAEPPAAAVARGPAVPEAPEPPATGSAPDAADEAAEMQNFLDRSPVLGARPKPARPRAVVSERSPTAATLATLASEVAHLGVTEGQRAAVRAMLLDLAREFDDNRASWETIRHAVVFVMEYPPLARRVLPLLIPYLDQAA